MNREAFMRLRPNWTLEPPGKVSWVQVADMIADTVIDEGYAPNKDEIELLAYALRERKSNAQALMEQLLSQ